ncbi:MAG: DMT family transporter [Asticcacaulis sp.]|nr:DMT family transporter [Asticcacaulis sp.]
MPVRAYSLLILIAFIWAGNSVAGKIGSGHVDPILLTSLRWGIAALVICVIAWPKLRGDWPVIRRHWPLLLAYGASGFALFNMLLYSALTQTAAVNVMIEQAGIPIFIFLINFALFRTRASWAQMAGFALTFTGILITASHGDLGRLLRLQLNAGDAMMFIAVIVYAGYTVALRWKPPLHWQSFLAIPCLGAALTCLPVLAWRYVTHPFPAPDATGWGVVAYAALMVALLASATYVAGVELIGANRAGLFINLLPIFGVIQSVIILREPLHGFHIVALILVCAGIVLAEWQRLRSA